LFFKRFIKSNCLFYHSIRGLQLGGCYTCYRKYCLFYHSIRGLQLR